MRSRTILLCCLAVSLSLHPALADEGHSHGLAGKVGTVVFPISCSAAAQQAFPHAVALLYSFEYETALAEFTAITEQDPRCGMAWWGVAMTYWHPLWFPPTPSDLRAGQAAAEKAVGLSARTGRERGFIAAIAAFYRDFDKLDHAARAQAYSRQMEALYQQYPKDNEVAVFYALSLLATADPKDKTYAHQLQAGSILERIFAQQPDHPGAAHYIIHSFDNPTLAPRALKAAYAYAKIAPAAPHALHMPSHIFTRLGLWQDSINSNLASAAAAKRLADTGRMPGARGEQLHAMDYLMYAYLQMGRDAEARGVMTEALAMRETAPQLKEAYAVNAIPARFALERRQWEEAAALPVVPGQSPATAITHWARGLGAAHAGDLATARQELAALEQIRDHLRKTQVGYDWATQVEIQRLEVAAWIAHAEGKNEEALALARSAADLDDSTEKHPVTPGTVLPARELLGDLLLDLKQPAEAVAAYETSLRSAPRRFNSLYGAARAAELAGDRPKANQYYAQLVEICGKDCQRPEFERAKTFIARK
jgi:tetratricopeptide (TPR) repeat protein